MGLTPKPKKSIDLSKIDDIQNEIFGSERSGLAAGVPEIKTETIAVTEKSSSGRPKAAGAKKSKAGNPAAKSSVISRVSDTNSKTANVIASQEPSPDLTIADLLATAKSQGARYTTRPYTVPRSLTIDLNRLKSMFRTRDLQYTQTELMEKMLKESLEIVTEKNYLELRDKAFALLKSPEQCSRRSVTLTEDTFFGMGELKADLTQNHGRRFSNDELLTMLLAVAFTPLYERGVL